MSRLNAPLAGGGDVSTDFYTQFIISPDGTRAVYVADQDTDDVLELYSVPLTGGAPTKLSGSLVPGGDVKWFRTSPNGSRVVFMADKDTDGVVELYSVPTAGGAIVKLNGTLTPGGSFGPNHMNDVAISPDSSRVIYVVDQDTDEFRELYSVPIGGGTSIKLNGAIPVGDDVKPDPIFSPDSATVVYVTEGSSLEVYSVPAAGGTSTLLTTPVPNGVQPQISADGSRVVYQRHPISALYSVPIGGGPQTQLNGTLTPGGMVQEFWLSADSSRVIYRADQDTDEIFELYSVPIGGGAVTRLNTGKVLGWDLSRSSRIIYTADQLNNNVVELFSVPVDGGPPTRLSGPLVAGGDVVEFLNMGDHVAFTADKDSDEVFELYSAPTDGAAPPTKLSAPFVAGGSIYFINDVSLDASIVTYIADQDTDDVLELYSVPMAGGQVTKLNAPLPVGGEVWLGLFSPDGSRMVYTASQDTAGVYELYRVDPRTGADTDGDGILNGCDICMSTPDQNQDDTDGNGLGDACQTCALDADPDADDVCGAADNCPTVPNAGQADFDADGVGNACDDDDDNDGLADEVETDTGTFVSADNTGSDPLDPDSDDDGVTDGNEVLQGTDPNTASDLPGSVFGGKSVISATADGATAVVTADVDADGDVDVLAVSGDDDTVAWYENNGMTPPGWTEHVIDGIGDNPGSIFAADIDGDGDVDALSASPIDDEFVWYENDGTPASAPGQST